MTAVQEQKMIDESKKVGSGMGIDWVSIFNASRVALDIFAPTVSVIGHNDTMTQMTQMAQMAQMAITQLSLIVTT